MSQPSTTALTVQVAMDTHVGQQRGQNQDAIGQLFPADPTTRRDLGQIFVLADGVGGLSGGDLASQYAVSTIISSYYDQEEGDPPKRLARAIAEANNVIYAEGQDQENPTIMATTVVAAVVRGRELIIGSVGDSPAYLMRDAEPRQLTLDHNVETMRRETGEEPLDAGDPNARKLVRALGSNPSVKVDIITGRVRHGDHVVLCSDGLTRYVSPEEIEETIATRSLERAVQTLIELANERGGADNISLIALRLVDETDEGVVAQLPTIPDPMEAWGRPRAQSRQAPPQPPARVVKIESRAAPRPPVDNVFRDLWNLLRGNTMITTVGLGALLVIFVIIMIIVATANDGSAGGGAQAPATRTPDFTQTATAQIVITTTARIAAAQTEDALLEATAAEAARRTLTPPTPMPTSGPQLESATWFKVLPDEPIITFVQPDLNAEAATSLQPGDNFRVIVVNRDAPNGPWYQVVDNLGLEARWVSAPTMHQRIVVIDETGSPLPDSQQPVDIVPPDMAIPTRTPTQTPSPLPTMPGTPGTPATPLPTSTPTPSRTPQIVYGVEAWDVGERVTTRDALNLCHVPEVTACDVGQVAAGETGSLIGGPVPSGEHWWWQVEFDEQRAGWIAQVLLAAQ